MRFLRPRTLGPCCSLSYGGETCGSLSRFWGWGIGGNILFVSLLETLRSVRLAPFWPSWFLYNAFYIFMMVAIWRSAEKYPGARSWALLARAVVVIQAVRMLIEVYGSLHLGS